MRVCVCVCVCMLVFSFLTPDKEKIEVPPIKRMRFDSCLGIINSYVCAFLYDCTTVYLT